MAYGRRNAVNPILLPENRFNPCLTDGSKRPGKQRRHQAATMASSLRQIMTPAGYYVLPCPRLRLP